MKQLIRKYLNSEVRNGKWFIDRHLTGVFFTRPRNAGSNRNAGDRRKRTEMRARYGDSGHCRSIATIGERTPSNGRCHRQRGARASGHDSGSTVEAVSALLPSFSPNERKAERLGDSERSLAALGHQRNSAVDVCTRQVTRWPHDRSFLHRPVEVTYGSNTLQGIGDTGGVVNQVTVGAPREGGIAVRTLAKVTLPDG